MGVRIMTTKSRVKRDCRKGHSNIRAKVGDYCSECSEPLATDDEAEVTVSDACSSLFSIAGSTASGPTVS
jgi:hypothetical protein